MESHDRLAAEPQAAEESSRSHLALVGSGSPEASTGPAPAETASRPEPKEPESKLDAARAADRALSDAERARIEENDRRRDRYIERAAAERRAERRQGWLPRLISLGFPRLQAESIHAKAPEWPDPGAVNDGREIICRTGGMLLLVGPRGLGKSQMAIQYSAELYLAGVVDTPRYWTALDLTTAERRTWNPKRGLGDFTPYEQAKRCGLLVLDEIHAAKPDALEEIADIIDARYAARRRTLLVGNCDFDAAHRILGESVWSRLTEMGGAVHCDWPSFRTGGQG